MRNFNSESVEAYLFFKLLVSAETKARHEKTGPVQPVLKRPNQDKLKAICRHEGSKVHSRNRTKSCMDNEQAEVYRISLLYGLVLEIGLKIQNL